MTDAEPTPVLRMVLQRREWDCGVAALSSLTGVAYEEVLAAAARVAPRVEEDGLYLTQMEKIAHELDASLVRKRSSQVDFETDTGILHVYDVRAHVYHVVLLWEGRILETDGSAWHADVYLATKRFKAGCLLVLEG